jgi:hypothetical protein
MDNWNEVESKNYKDESATTDGSCIKCKGKNCIGYSVFIKSGTAVSTDMSYSEGYARHLTDKTNVIRKAGHKEDLEMIAGTNQQLWH